MVTLSELSNQYLNDSDLQELMKPKTYLEENKVYIGHEKIDKYQTPLNIESINKSIRIYKKAIIDHEYYNGYELSRINQSIELLEKIVVYLNSA